jgi:phosphatidylinositol alpha-1,6-mannosyltransferase
MARKVRGALRILMLATDAHGGYGGIAQYTRDILEALSKLEGVNEVVVLPRTGSSETGPLPAKIRYDVSGLASLAGYVRSALRHAVFGGSFDLVYCAHVNLAPLAAVIAKLQGAPMLLAIYGIDAWAPPRRALVRMSAGAAQFVVSISQITLTRFLSWRPYPAEATAVLPNAIHMQEYAMGPKDRGLLSQLGLAGRTIVMTFGRMSHDEGYKGFDQVLEVLPDLALQKPDIAYLAVGDGTDRARLEMKAEALGLAGRVIFPGRIPESLKADYFRLADAYVMPSTGEGFGFVILEALACGIPVVASTADGTREAVQGGALGALVDPNDPQALKAAILDCLQRPKSIPIGLAYFGIDNFTERLNEALSRWLPTINRG